MTRSGAGLQPPLSPRSIPYPSLPRDPATDGVSARRSPRHRCPSSLNRTCSTAPRPRSAIRSPLRPPISVFLSLSLSPPRSFSLAPSASLRSTNPSRSFRQPRLTRPIYILFLDSFPSGHNFDRTAIRKCSLSLVRSYTRSPSLFLSTRVARPEYFFFLPSPFLRARSGCLTRLSRRFALAFSRFSFPKCVGFLGRAYVARPRAIISRGNLSTEFEGSACSPSPLPPLRRRALLITKHTRFYLASSRSFFSRGGVAPARYDFPAIKRSILSINRARGALDCNESMLSRLDHRRR